MEVLCPAMGEEQREARAMTQKGEHPAPVEWIGQEVEIGVGRRTDVRLSGELLEVNDRGVVVHVGGEGNRKPARVFYAWRNVQAIQLPDEEQTE